MQGLRLVLMSVVLFLASFTSFAEPGDSNFVEAVKNSRASTLEKGLPNLIVKDWVNKNFKKGTETKWTINDCGEGWHVNDPQTPTCVEIQIPQENGYHLHINSIIEVTTEEEITKPQLWMVYFYKGEGYKTIDVINVKTIEEAIHLYQTNLGGK